MQCTRLPLRRNLAWRGRASWVEDALHFDVLRHSEAAPDVDVAMPCLAFGAETSSLYPGAMEKSQPRISLEYRSDVYAYSLLSASTILQEACGRGILERNIDTAKFFVHPLVLIRNHTMFSRFFGVDRSPAFSRLLRELLAAYDADRSSVFQACCLHSADTAKWIPFLRGLCLCVAAGDPFVTQATHVIRNCVLGSNTPDSLALPGNYHERGISMADLLVEAGVEFGLIGISQLGISLYRQFLPETPLAASRRLAVCITRSERRYLEWNMRCFPRKRRRR